MIHDDQREGSLPGRGDSHQGYLEAPLVGPFVVHGAGDSLGHEIGVCRGARHAESLGQLRGVGEVPVVAKRDACGPDLAVGGLGVGPVVGAGRRVADVADSEVAVKTGESGLVEHPRDET